MVSRWAAMTIVTVCRSSVAASGHTGKGEMRSAARYSLASSVVQLHLASLLVVADYDI